MNPKETTLSAPWPPTALVEQGHWVDLDSLQLLEIFQNGTGVEKAEALSIIYNKYCKSIWDYIYAQVNGVEAEAQDIFGQIWLIATEELAHFERREDTIASDPLRSWLFRCASNRIKKYHREKHANVALEVVENFVLARLQGEDTELYELFAPGVKNKATELVVAATKQLKKEQKMILWLRYNRGLTFAEIAEEVGKKENAVKVQHHRLLNKLRARFDDVNYE